MTRLLTALLAALAAGALIASAHMAGELVRADAALDRMESHLDSIRAAGL